MNDANNPRQSSAAPWDSALPEGNGPPQDAAQPQEIPDGYTYHLPHYAVTTDTVSVPTPDGMELTHVRLLHTPNQDYLARRINSGEEFAIGGNKRHIVQELALELARRPEVRWHIIAVKDDNLAMLGAPRRAYSLYPQAFDVDSIGTYDSSLDIVGQEGISRPDLILPAAEALLVPGTDYFPPRGHDGTFKDGGRAFRESLRSNVNVVNADQAEQMLSLTGGGLPSIGGGEPEPFNFDFLNFDHVNLGPEFLGPMTQNDDMMEDIQMQGNQVDPFVSPQFPDIESQHTANHNAGLSLPSPVLQQYGDQLSPEQERQAAQWLKEFRAYQKKQRADQKKESKESDEATIEADDVWDDYTGTNLCRWCGRRGHEAVECIKWDPDHLDKLVCTKCNNKKHVLDECPAFKDLPLEGKENLLLVDGAHRPGARSLYWDWTSLIDVDTHTPDTSVPMTREFIRKLLATPSGSMWANLWKTFPYGDRPMPEQFHDKDFQPGDHDEAFEFYYPLIMREGDKVYVPDPIQRDESQIQKD